mmetsp:Transcript_10743/g.24518  ORF Transcript_10743/g.24518 Transcript_10743/m.24518 type:complete len:113 (+) Transcript_10743:1223-1561(+)
MDIASGEALPLLGGICLETWVVAPIRTPILEIASEIGLWEEGIPSQGFHHHRGCLPCPLCHAPKEVAQVLAKGKVEDLALKAERLERLPESEHEVAESVKEAPNASEVPRRL